MNPLLSIEDAAEMLGVDYKTVWRLIRSGELPAGRVGRVYRLSEADLAAWFEQQKAATARETGGPSPGRPPDHARHTPVALRDLRCCRTGQRIVSELDIGGYASDTGEPICRAAWDAGHRTAGHHRAAARTGADLDPKSTSQPEKE